jgi:hypothetical protein
MQFELDTSHHRSASFINATSVSGKATCLSIVSLQETVRGIVVSLVLGTLIVLYTGAAIAQETVSSSLIQVADQSQATLPFEVSNPKHKKWPEAEAGRIYSWACDLLARSIRPEKPPELRPKFRLVLGAEHDEFVRDGNATEVHLKSWDPEKFAQGVVVVALRDLLPKTDLARLARQSVSLADSTLDVRDMQH